jgi:hypothetical protein
MNGSPRGSPAQLVWASGLLALPPLQATLQPNKTPIIAEVMETGCLLYIVTSLSAKSYGKTPQQLPTGTTWLPILCLAPTKTD